MRASAANSESDSEFLSDPVSVFLAFFSSWIFYYIKRGIVPVVCNLLREVDYIGEF